MTDSFDIQYGGRGEEKVGGSEGEEQSEQAEQAYGVFNHNFCQCRRLHGGKRLLLI